MLTFVKMTIFYIYGLWENFNKLNWWWSCWNFITFYVIVLVVKVGFQKT